MSGVLEIFDISVSEKTSFGSATSLICSSWIGTESSGRTGPLERPHLDGDSRRGFRQGEGG